MPEVASRVVADLGASDLALDAFSSGASAHLQVCEKYWSAQDSAWKKHWGPLKQVRTPVAIFGSLGVCIYVPASRHWLISYSPIHLA